MVIFNYKPTKRSSMNNIKNTITLTLLFSATLALADNENYDGQDVSGWNFSEQSLINSSWITANATSTNFAYATLTNANFTNTAVNNANFCGTISSGFTKEQLYSTKSYLDKNLSGINLIGNDLSAWNFSTQNLTAAKFEHSTLTGTNFSESNLTSSSFYNSTLKNSNLTGANLTSANFEYATLTGVNFSNATINNAKFGYSVSNSFTKEQLYSTKSYQNNNLIGIDFRGNNLANWNFSGQKLTSANFTEAKLTGANFTNAAINNANFNYASTKGFTKEQLYSTRSYQSKNLSGVSFENNNFYNWDFSEQNLTSASFKETNLNYADFTNVNLTSVNFENANLYYANFTGAIINSAIFKSANSFSFEQLYSTKNYQIKNLSGISFEDISIYGWDFSGQNLTLANFKDAGSWNANFTAADLRGADTTRSTRTGTEIYRTTIMTDGVIKNFTMTSSEDTLVIRQFIPQIGNPMISAKISEANATVSGGAVLTLETGAALEVVNNKTLTIAGDGNLVINTDAAGSTSLHVESGAGLAFEDGAILRVNIEGVFSASDVSVLTIMGWEDDSHITGANLFVVDETIFLTVNGEAYSGDWDYRIADNQFQVFFGQIPEPAFCAVVLGVLALAFAARRRKAK